MRWPPRDLLLAIGLVAVLAVSTGALATWRMGWTYDSFLYGLVAERVADGRGLTTPIVFLRRGEPLPNERGDAPYTAQAPLYPVVLAATGGANPGHERGARWLNLLSHLATCLLVFAFARRAGLAAATGAGVATALCGPLLIHGASWVLADGVFVALYLAPLGALIAARGCQGRAAHAWRLLAGTAAALCVATRYPGLALAAPLGWEVLRVARREGRRPAIWVALEALLPLLVCGAGLLVRNVMLSGHLRGMAPGEVQRNVFEAGWALIAGLASALGSLPLAAELLVLCLGLALPLGAVVFALRKGEEDLAPTLRHLDLVAVAALGYALLLAWALRAEPRVEPRYLLPLLPLILAAGALVGRLGQRLLSTAGRPRWGALGLALTVAVLAGPNAVRVAKLPQGEQSFPYLYSEVHRWVSEHVPPNAPVATNDAIRLAYFGNHPSLALPTKAWNPGEVLPHMEVWLPQAMRKVGARHLVLVVGQRGLSSGGWGTLVSDLSLRKEPTPPSFERLWSGRDGVVYALMD